MLNFSLRGPCNGKSIMNAVGAYLALFIDRDITDLKIGIILIFANNPANGFFACFLRRFSLPHEFNNKETAHRFKDFFPQPCSCSTTDFIINK